MPSAVYRSTVARLIVAALGIGAGLLFVFGDHAKWQTTPSFDFLARLPVPLDVGGWLAVIHGVLVLIPRARTAGYALGAFVYSTVAVGLVATLMHAGPKNVFAVTGCMIAALYCLQGMRLSVFDRVFR